MERTQRALLMDLVRKNQDSLFGRRFSFDKINSIGAYRRMVPLSTYQDYHHDIQEVKAAKPHVLTSEPVCRLHPSSGTIDATKYLPFTPGLRRGFRNAIMPWLFDLLLHRMSIWPGKLYWSITPVGPGRSALSKESLVPVSFDDDMDYLSLVDKLSLSILSAVPPAVGRIRKLAAFQYATLLFLVKESELRFISVWNPTFMTLIIEKLPAWLDRIADDIQHGTLTFPESIDPAIYRDLSSRMRADDKRATEIRSLQKLDSKTISGITGHIWPNLKLISVWAHGNARLGLGRLRRYFPKAEIQPKGLIATEAFVSFPQFSAAAEDPGSTLAITSHFFEFIPVSSLAAPTERNMSTLLAHEIEAGRQYSVVVTTQGGLYRYQLHDIIEVTEIRGNIPLIRFVGRENQVVDIVGEKLHGRHVETVIEKILDRFNLTPDFYMLAPERSGSAFAYTLFLTSVAGHSDIIEMAGALDAALCENHHYQYCRHLGQLKPVQAYLIEWGGEAPHIADLIMRSENKRLGDIKPMVLDANLDWSEIFPGRLLIDAPIGER